MSNNTVLICNVLVCLIAGPISSDPMAAHPPHAEARTALSNQKFLSQTRKY